MKPINSHCLQLASHAQFSHKNKSTNQCCFEEVDNLGIRCLGSEGHLPGEGQIDTFWGDPNKGGPLGGHVDYDRTVGVFLRHL